MYAVFGDESHDEDKQRVFCVSGVFGATEQWKSLAKAWVERTGGKEFKAADCDSDKGEFAHTSHAENKKLYKDLTLLLTKTNLFGYTVSLDLQAYRESFPKSQEPNDPYYFCFHGVIVNFAEINSVCIPRGKVEFTFDINHEVQFNAGQLYDFMMRLPEWRGKDLLAEKVSFTGSRIPEIQAADLVAREGMKLMDNRIGPNPRPIRRSTIALKQTKRFKFTEIGRDELRALLQRLNSVDLPGADMNKWREWLRRYGLARNTSNLLRYHHHILSQIQSPAEKPTVVQFEKDRNLTDNGIAYKSSEVST